MFISPGNYADTCTFVEWCRAGMNRHKLPEFRFFGDDFKPSFRALVWSPERALVEWTEQFQPMPVLDDFYAIGSGDMAAMAAMHMGATAGQAVEVAAKVDLGTGGIIETERVSNLKVA